MEYDPMNIERRFTICIKNNIKSPNKVYGLLIDTIPEKKT